jgi:hypothetical protein
MYDDYLDKPLRGGKAIGQAAEFVDHHGNVELNKVYRALALRHLDASKHGKQWVSTRRRILASFMGGAK